MELGYDQAMNKLTWLYLAMAVGVIGLGYMTQQFWKYGKLALPNRPLIISTILVIISGGLIIKGLSMP